MNPEQVKSAIRWAITVIGPILSSYGYISSSTIETIGGALITLIPFIWSMTTHTQSNAVAVVNEIAKQPGSPVKGVVTAPTIAGNELAASIPGPLVVMAGTEQAASLAAR